MQFLVMFGLLLMLGCPAKVADDAAPVVPDAGAKVIDAGKAAQPLDVAKRD